MRLVNVSYKQLSLSWRLFNSLILPLPTDDEEKREEQRKSNSGGVSYDRGRKVKGMEKGKGNIQAYAEKK